MTDSPITPPPPHLLKKFSAQAQDETKKRNGAGYLKTFATLCIEWAMNCQPTSNDSQIRSSEIEPPSDQQVGEWLCDDGYPWNPSDQVTITITTNRLRNVATKAAQWGADQELEACCKWLLSNKGACFNSRTARELRTTRRTKPLSLKEQALNLLAPISGPVMLGTPEYHLREPQVEIIRRALEALPND
jgi:hypothetical protein